MTVEMDTERTRARHRDKTQDVFAEESEALDQIAKQVIVNSLLSWTQGFKQTEIFDSNLIPKESSRFKLKSTSLWSMSIYSVRSLKMSQMES